MKAENDGAESGRSELADGNEETFNEVEGEAVDIHGRMEDTNCNRPPKPQCNGVFKTFRVFLRTISQCRCASA
jgi:hypothetical protein